MRKEGHGNLLKLKREDWFGSIVGRTHEDQVALSGATKLAVADAR